MASINETIKLVQSAVSRSEIKSAVQSCLALTESLGKNNLYQSGVWFPIGESLINALNPSFVGVFSKTEYEQLFVEIFVRAPAVDSIPLLVHSLKNGVGEKSKNGYVLEKVLHVLDVVVKKNLARLFVGFTSPSTSDFSDGADRLIQDLVSIPDRAAAVVRGGRVDGISVLNSDSYSKTVALAMIEALKLSHQLLSSGSDCSLKFVSDALGKFYLNGYGRSIMEILAPRIYGYCSNDSGPSDDFIWRRLSKRLFAGVHTLALDEVIGDLVVVLSSRDPGKIVDLEKLLGDSVEKEEKIKYVLTRKLLLTRRFDQTLLVPETIFRYLSSTAERRQSILRPTLIKLLTVWSSASAITRIDFEKHFYISRSILVGCRHLTDDERFGLQQDATPFIFRGISAHLGAVDENVRKIGMVLGELLTNVFAAGKSEEKLKFEYEEDERTRYLKNLLTVGEETEFVSPTEFLESKEDEGARSSSPSKDQDRKVEYRIAAGIDSDDDEDLVPYDLPKETDDENGTSKDPLPVYIRDCLDCIVERKSFRQYEIALRSLEKMIRRNSPGADDLATEIARTLLHAEDHYGLGSEFSTLQRSIMTASCVKRPKDVAVYLAEELYGKNYSIQHRLLILDVLMQAAKELSKPTAESESGDIDVITVTKQEPATPTPLVPTWRQVVQARLEKKTRRWGSAVTGQRSKLSQVPAPNRFAALAGPYFFFPLLVNLEKRIETLDMFGTDYIVLGRLLFVTGTILYEAENAPGICSMAVSQMHIVLRRTFRHEQPFVRQGSLFALIMAFSVIPSRILAVEYQDELLEAQDWLEKTKRDDPDDQCRLLADEALRLVARKANEGLNSVIEVGLPK